ncbi:ABC transporter G family member 18 [Eurosta solidaginis]|uniref:ABC transporter G family member 18 n=1 Tax=Eurosta solidaginis TaxID=178769 RepID=UPI0035306255
MTVIQDIKPTDAYGAGINCCSSVASSETSIDKTTVCVKPSCTANDLSKPCNYDNFEANFNHCKQIDIEFENVKYTVRKFNFQKRKFVSKEILHGVNGAFRSGELTAIMGPSGSGKSTLLNVMTGFRATGVTGTIRVNGEKISTNSSTFRELSCYIHQDDLLRPQMTVGETMMLAAHLKLGFSSSKEYKQTLIKHILALLGLEHRYNVFAAKLSGGQKKRLAIALELISNPPVLFLDEPTSGLDSSSCSQCVMLLKKLASLGHTIVCTIHQPSALIFEMFDKLYAVVDGNCIYQGPVRELIPFLAGQDLVCPSYHNPADFLLEVAVGEHDRDLVKLINAANKKYHEDVDSQQINVHRLLSRLKDNETCSRIASSFKRFPTTLSKITAFDYVKPAADDVALEEVKTLNAKAANTKANDSDDEIGLAAHAQTDGPRYGVKKTVRTQPASFVMQYFLLLNRIFLCARRNYFLLLARVMSHIVIGVVFGYLYMNVGDKATTVLGNYVYLYGTILLLVYTGKMAVVLTFPLEIGMLTREHFNRWYGLTPYFLSLLSFEIPFQSICAVLYMIISVYLTGNNTDESFRIYYFVALAILATLSAQSWGFFVGATLPTKLAVFLGPILAVLFSVFGFCTRYIDITPIFRWMWHISYFRAGFHGALNAIYGLDRSFLTCPETAMYCHFRSPKVFLNYMMISDVNMADCVTLMIVVIAVMHALTLITLWHKLNKRTRLSEVVMNLNDLTVLQLKEVLQKLEQKTSGSKSELIGRLQELDQELVNGALEMVIAERAASMKFSQGQERSDASTTNDLEVRKQLEAQISGLCSAVDMLTTQVQTLRSSMPNTIGTTACTYSNDSSTLFIPQSTVIIEGGCCSIKTIGKDVLDIGDKLQARMEGNLVKLKTMNSCGEVAGNDIIIMTNIITEHHQGNAIPSFVNINEPLLSTIKCEVPVADKITKKQFLMTETNPATQSSTIPYKSSNNDANRPCGPSANIQTPNLPMLAETGNAILSNAGMYTLNKKKCENTTSPTLLEREGQKEIKSLNMTFDNICYGVKTGFFKQNYKQILQGITGEFRAGELSGVIGPSGMGKSTLLNILASYTIYGYTGDIRINGNLRDIKAFKPNVAYITQDFTLQQFLTVKEAMQFAANLKIGSEMTNAEKKERTLKILEAVDLKESLNIRTGDLSGGQKKRLAISLELVNNPPILILDEPTSGLDSSTTNHIISLLKNLASAGHNIICTIHQPSGLCFRMFDHLYAIAEGSCIYAGRPENLVPYLAESNLPCPQSYNPCDFLMEIGTNDYGPNNQRLIEKMQNGRNNEYRLADRFGPATIKSQLKSVDEFCSRSIVSYGLVSDIKANVKEQRSSIDCKHLQPRKPNVQLVTGHLCKRENVYATPFYRQLSILLTRSFLILWRDSSLTTLRFSIHFGVALLIGFLYYGIGNDAANAMNIFRYAFYTVMFISFCAFSSILTNFPLEFPIVCREHFNRWYSLRAYYCALTLADIPIQIISSSLFLFTTYYLTGQPLELMRFALYFTITVLTALVGQSIGLTVGSAMSVQYGAIFGPFFICPFLLFSGFFLQRRDSPAYLSFMFDISFYKHALDGSMTALFGYGRDKLKCNDIYCHHRHPAFFLRDLDLANISFEMSAIYLISLLVLLRITAFYIMSFRLRLFR